MYEKNTLKIKIGSTVFIIALGILFHFTFELSNQNTIVGIFSSVNESVWEHLKLIFFPMLINLILGYCYKGKNIENYICAKSLGIIKAIKFIIIFFYTYTGIIGKNFPIIDISSFIIAVILGQYVSYKKMKSKSYCNKKAAIMFLITLASLFVIFTFLPPNINLFKNPETGTFGI